MNEYRVTCDVYIEGRFLTVELNASGNNEDEAFIDATKFLINVCRVGACKALKAVCVNSYV